MSVDGEWDVTVNSPMGVQKGVLTLKTDGGVLTGTNVGPMGTWPLIDGKVDGDKLSWKAEMTSPVKVTLEATATVSGDTLTGSMKAGMFGSSPMSGVRRA